MSICWKREGEDWKQSSCRSIDDLVRAVLDRSAAGYDTYFACGCFDAPGVRTAVRSAGARSLWLDLDAGSGKPYATAGDAAQALAKFCQATGLPLPTVVCSGGGVHAYWTFERVLLPAEWQSASERLHAAVVAHGLHADPSRTRDIASVLRPVGTVNFKNGGRRPVFGGAFRSAVSIDFILARLPSIPLSPQRERTHSRLNEEFLAYAKNPVFGESVAAECRWLRTVGSEKKGNVSEPVWYAMLGLVGWLDDAEETAEAWSNGHPSYSQEETIAKMEQARARQSGPTTCQKFKDVWPDGCKGCPHQISTPLQLGRHGPADDVQGRMGAPTIAPGNPEVVRPPDLDGLNLPPLTFPYSWRQGDNALMRATKSDAGDTVLKILYPFPIYIGAIRRGEIGNQSFTTIRHWAPHDGWHESVIPSGDLTSDGAFRVLGNAHIQIDPLEQKNFTLFLSRSIEIYRKTHRAELHHETFGWKDDDSFLIGDRLYRGGETLSAGISEELAKYAPKLKPSGSLPAWSDAAQPLFRPGYEHQGMAVLASFASVLMRYAPYQGMFYSIVNEMSGRGKTFGLTAAGSVWGQAKALEISHRDEKVSTGDTIKSQYRQIALMKSLPVLVDELRDMEAEKAARLRTQHHGRCRQPRADQGRQDARPADDLVDGADLDQQQEPDRRDHSEQRPGGGLADLRGERDAAGRRRHCGWG